jgi:hypothetical protein
MLVKLTAQAAQAFGENGRTGWLYTDAMLLTGCPRCHAEKNHVCVTSGERQAWPPHAERLRAFKDINTTK